MIFLSEGLPCLYTLLQLGPASDRYKLNFHFISPFFCLPTKNWRNSCVPRIDRNGEEASVCLSSFFNYQIEKTQWRNILGCQRLGQNSTPLLYYSKLMLWYWRKNNFRLWQASKRPFSWIQLSETSVVKEVGLKGWWNRSVLVFSSFHCMFWQRPF